jgi:hypothetical protein
MAYYIFLKSLRSLEEFRKNPDVKIPPKSPSTNFQSLGKFKNPIFNSEILFPYFRPGRPCGPLGPRWPPFSHRPKPTGQPKPLSPRIDSVFAEVCFPFWFAPFELATSSLSQAGPCCQLRPSYLAARARPRHHRSPATPRRPAPRLECRRAVTTPP